MSVLVFPMNLPVKAVAIVAETEYMISSPQAVMMLRA